MRKSYRKLEELEANATGADAAPAQLRESVEYTVETCGEYMTYLEGQLSTTMHAVHEWTHLIEHIYQQITYHQMVLGMQQDGSADQAVALQYISNLQGQLQQAMDVRNKLSEEQIENECQLMEQLYITKQMKEEYTNVLKKHEGCASRLIGASLNANGVDENVYHKRSIDGNHCMKLAQNGTKIVDQITIEMKKVIKDDKNVEYLTKLDASFKNILSIWYRMMRVMKSVDRQSPRAITEFKTDTIALKRAVADFIKNEPVPGTDNTLPTFLKSHILFDNHIQEFLVLWETIGAFDEQGIESTHPNLMNYYGDTEAPEV